MRRKGNRKQEGIHIFAGTKIRSRMPGDTLKVTVEGDTIRVSDSLFHQTQISSPPSALTADAPDNSLLFFSAIGILLLRIFTPVIIAARFRKFRRKKIHNEALERVSEHYPQYDNLLSSYNGYYRNLPSPLQQKFLERVIEFSVPKNFKYLDIEKDDKMPLLISAAAVQLTFGLDKFLFDSFDTIYVLKHDYQYGANAMPFMGHVSRNGIYLSWDNFIKGFEDDTDGNNVGIHEMAHALAFVNFKVDDEEAADNLFKRRFKEFSTIARAVFNAMQNGETNMLGTYATSNYNEFWAVAVEFFFEKSLQMKVELPHLYIAMTYLLNQDPLMEQKILNHDEV